MTGTESQNSNKFNDLLKNIKQAGREIIGPNAADVDMHARFPHESIQALKDLKLLSCYVPTELGGMGLNVVQVAKICEILGHFCASTAMIFAMHKIQVACVLHHYGTSTYLKGYLKKLVAVP